MTKFALEVIFLLSASQGEYKEGNNAARSACINQAYYNYHATNSACQTQYMFDYSKLIPCQSAARGHMLQETQACYDKFPFT